MSKITRSFTIEEEAFKRFKSILALQGYTSASKVLELLIIKFNTKPEEFEAYAK
jgi:hypothetical protein